MLSCICGVFSMVGVVIGGGVAECRVTSVGSRVWWFGCIWSDCGGVSGLMVVEYLICWLWSIRSDVLAYRLPVVDYPVWCLGRRWSVGCVFASVRCGVSGRMVLYVPVS